MAEKLVIQLLEEEISADDADIVRQFRWCYVDELADWPDDAETGSGEDLLMDLEGVTEPAVLLIPGSKTVARSIPYSKKEARHFLKLLPYQIEDDVLGPVEELHFAVAPIKDKEAESVAVAYVDQGWLFSLLEWFQQNQIAIEQCIADFQCLRAVDNELLLWFVDDHLLGHRANGLGFSVSQPLSQAFLKDLLLQQQDEDAPWQVKIYVNDAETREILESHIMPPVDYEAVIGQPPLEFIQDNHLNFCSGKYGKKLPIEQWWQEAKPIAILAAVATAIFFVATFADIYLLKQQQERYRDDMLVAYREVIPRGPATDPVRRLRSKLGSGAATSQSSQSVYLLSRVAPILDKLDISLTTVKYSNREQALRITINAASFNGIEQFRQQIEQQGVSAELQSSNAAKEGFQARLRIALRGGA